MIIETTVAEVLKTKERPGVLTISPQETVLDALKTMALHDVGALLVMEAGRIHGIITERDYARKLVLNNRASRTTFVHEIMEPHVLWVEPSDPVEACLTLMTENRIRHLVVLSKGTLTGIISMRDVVTTLLDSQVHMIDDLTKYVRGSYSGWLGPHAPGRAMVEQRML